LSATLHEVENLGIVIFISFFLGVILFFLSAVIAPQVFSLEKNQAYECGFEPFEDARSKFDVRFYLVGLLFIIFDLEVAFLFPVVGVFFSFSSLLVFFLFLFILTLGFVYEWFGGALQWS